MSRDGVGEEPPEEKEGLTGIDTLLFGEETPFDLCSVHPGIPIHTNACLLQGLLAPTMFKPLLEGTKENSSRTRG